MKYEDAISRCWLEVDLDAIQANFYAAVALMGGIEKLIPVLKADAYGMGATEVGRLLAEEGVRLFAVATGDEAEQLVRALPEGAKVLTLGLVGRSQMARLIRAGMPLTLFSKKQGKLIEASAVEADRKAVVHVKIDTGLHRIGLDPDKAAEIMEEICASGLVEIEGLYTHLGIHSAQMDQIQTQTLREVGGALLKRGIQVKIMHAVDSIGMARYPEDHMDAARVGAWLYGVAPYRYENPELCRNVACFKARVSQLRTVKKGELVGYDDDHPLARDTRVATLSAGYVDGFPRLAHGKEIEIRGRRARVIGIVCMDQMMADVSDIPEVEEGDEAVLLGGGIPVDEYAAAFGLNRNEAWARIGRRVPRVYFRDGNPAGVRSEVG